MPELFDLAVYTGLAAMLVFAIVITVKRWRAEEAEYAALDDDDEDFDDEDEEEEAPKPLPVVKVRKKSNKDQALVDDFIALGSIRAAAIKNKVGQARVKAAVTNAGLVPNQSYRNRVSASTRKAIQDDLLSGELTKAEIARTYGVSGTTVLRISREAL